MRLTSAEKILIAAAIAERHNLPIRDALDFADTAADALAVEDADDVIVAALALAP